MKNATSDAPPLLLKIAAKMGLHSAPASKPITSRPPAPDAKETPSSAKDGHPAPAPADGALDSLTPEDISVLAGMDKHLESLPTEAARDAYVSSLASMVTGTVKPTAKATAPALTLEQQYAALQTTEARAAFLKANRRTILRHD